jgi:hypothetical protein
VRLPAEPLPQARTGRAIHTHSLCQPTRVVQKPRAIPSRTQSERTAVVPHCVPVPPLVGHGRSFPPRRPSPPVSGPSQPARRARHEPARIAVKAISASGTPSRLDFPGSVSHYDGRRCGTTLVLLAAIAAVPGGVDAPRSVPANEASGSTLRHSFIPASGFRFMRHRAANPRKLTLSMVAAMQTWP